MIESTKASHDAKIRIAILYALRYQKQPRNQIQKIVQDLLKAGVPESRAALVFVTLNIAGADQRQDDLFANENFFSRGKGALKGLKGVENVYTQHTPHLVQTVDNLMRGRLRDTSYPFVSSGQGAAPMNPAERPQDVILFIIGGATYEEARSIAFLNAQHQRGAQPGAQQAAVGGVAGTGTRFLLGGSSIHNSKSYLDMIQDAASRFDARFAKPPANLGVGGPALNLSIGPVQLAVGGRQNGRVRADRWPAQLPACWTQSTSVRQPVELEISRQTSLVGSGRGSRAPSAADNEHRTFEEAGASDREVATIQGDKNLTQTCDGIVFHRARLRIPINQMPLPETNSSQTLSSGHFSQSSHAKGGLALTRKAISHQDPPQTTKPFFRLCFGFYVASNLHINDAFDDQFGIENPTARMVCHRVEIR